MRTLNDKLTKGQDTERDSMGSCPDLKLRYNKKEEVVQLVDECDPSPRFTSPRPLQALEYDKREIMHRKKSSNFLLDDPPNPEVTPIQRHPVSISPLSPIVNSSSIKKPKNSTQLF